VDNATGSPQSVTLAATTSPSATLSPTTVTLNEGTLSTTSPSQTVTLKNTGTASMSSIALSISGTNASEFAQTNTCGTSLAAGSSCTITLTFTPTASGTAAATLNVADNAAGSPQTVTLKGNGPGTNTVTMTLVRVPDDTYNAATVNTLPQVDNFILLATSTVDMTIYELTDTAMINDLVAQCKAGVKVRVILSSSEQSTDTTASNALNAQTNCSAIFSNTHFPDTHEKSVVIDAAIPSKAQVLISSGNFETGSDYSSSLGTYNYYVTGRDFEIYENDANDVAAVESTFNEDYAYPKGTTYPTGYVPSTGDQLVWSPTGDGANSRPAILSVINGATKTLILDQEEMSDSAIMTALESQASNGLTVQLTIPTGELTGTNLTNMKAAGVKINEYPATGNYLYIHAKVVIADYGTSAEKAFVGSENMSTNSLSSNRELGIILTDSTAPASQSMIQTLYTTLSNDFACISKAPTQATADCTTP